MNRILFTKKHIISSIGIALILILFIIGSWSLFISPQKTKLVDSQKKLDTLKNEVVGIETNLGTLKNNQILLESEVVVQWPIIPNGINLGDYFQELKAIDHSLAISNQSINFQDSLVYPEEATAEKQVRKVQIGFDVVGDSEMKLIFFVDQLEQGKRFVKVQDVIYRASESAGEAGEYSYSATVVIEMYYLSNFETGSAIEIDS